MPQIKFKVSNVKYGDCVRTNQTGLGDSAGIGTVMEKRLGLAYPPAE